MPDEDEDAYTIEPTHVRVFNEDSEQWTIDGADNDLNYTESCWSYDTFAEAVAAIPEFVEHATMSGVRWQWDTVRSRSARKVTNRPD
jgi:hypothetical protein